MEPERWAYVAVRLTEGQWSPEQISGWMRRERLDPLSPEEIHRHILRDQSAGGTLHTHTPTLHKLKATAGAPY